MRKNQKHHLEPTNFRLLEHFKKTNNRNAPTSPYVGVYETTKLLNLLNLGNVETRLSILKNTTLTQHDIDNQYNPKVNQHVHISILKSPHFSRFDGTIVSTDTTDPKIHPPSPDEEEIVLFSYRSPNSVKLMSIYEVVPPQAPAPLPTNSEELSQVRHRLSQLRYRMLLLRSTTSKHEADIRSQEKTIKHLEADIRSQGKTIKNLVELIENMPNCHTDNPV